MSTFPALKHGSILSLACPLGQPLGKVLSPSRRFIAEAEQRLAHCSPRLFDFTEKWIILKNGQRLLKIGIDATRKNVLSLCFCHRQMFFNRKFWNEGTVYVRSQSALKRMIIFRSYRNWNILCGRFLGVANNSKTSVHLWLFVTWSPSGHHLGIKFKKKNDVSGKEGDNAEAKQGKVSIRHSFSGYSMLYAPQIS